MSKRKYVNKQSYKHDHKNVVEQVSDEPSMTVPNEARTIGDLIEMYRAGQRPDQKNFQYLDVEDIRQIDKFHVHPGSLDFTDLEELHSKTEHEINKMEELKEKIRKEKEDVIDKNPETDKNHDGKIDSNAKENKEE